MISQTNNEDITGKIEDVFDQKISQIDLITRDTVEQVVQEAIQGGGSGGTSDTAKKLVSDNGCSVEFDNAKGILNINGSEDRTALLLKYNNSMQAGFIYLKSDDNEICNIGSRNSIILSNEYNINTKKTTTELYGNNIKLEGNATISGDLTVKGKIINNFDIKVKYQFVGDPTIYDTGNVLNNIVVENTEFYEITDDSLFPEEYKSNPLQYPYKYRIHKDSSTDDYYILLRIDKDEKYEYGDIITSNFDNETTTEIRPCDTPLLAVNGEKMFSLGGVYEDFEKVATIDFGDDFDTSNITNMQNMFSGCQKLTSLNIGNFDTSNVSNMGSMFSSCKALTSLDLKHFDSKVFEIGGMFQNCNAITNITFSDKFDTSGCTSMYRMFYGCSALEELDLSNFDMKSATDISEMVGSCTALKTVIFPACETFAPSDMIALLSGCTALETVKFYNLTITEDTGVYHVFLNCNALQYVIITTDKVNDYFRAILPVYLNTETSENGLTTFKRSESHTITHLTNIPESAEIGTFCETNGGIFDGYIKTASTDCICKVVQSNTLNSKIVGIICDKNKFASHGDVLVKVVPGTYNLGDILCPDITGKARVATETEKQFMMINAIPRPKITAFTEDQSLVACFIV